VSRAELGFALLCLALGCRDPAPPTRDAAPTFDLPLVYAGHKSDAAHMSGTGRESGGGSVSLEALRGKTVLLDFWATWCPPCVLEIDELNALQKELQDTDVRILAISIDTLPAEDLAAWVKEHGITYPVALASSDLATDYGADAFPFHVLVGPDGLIRERLESGFHDREELRALIARHTR